MTEVKNQPEMGLPSLGRITFNTIVEKAKSAADEAKEAAKAQQVSTEEITSLGTDTAIPIAA